MPRLHVLAREHCCAASRRANLQITLTMQPSVYLCYGCCGNSGKLHTGEYVVHNNSRSDWSERRRQMRRRTSFKCIPGGKRVLEKGLNNVFGARWVMNAHQICHCPLRPLKEYTHHQIWLISCVLLSFKYPLALLGCSRW